MHTLQVESEIFRRGTCEDVERIRCQYKDTHVFFATHDLIDLGVRVLGGGLFFCIRRQFASMFEGFQHVAIEEGRVERRAKTRPSVRVLKSSKSRYVLACLRIPRPVSRGLTHTVPALSALQP